MAGPEALCFTKAQHDVDSYHRGVTEMREMFGSERCWLGARICLKLDEFHGFSQLNVDIEGNRG